MQYATKTLAVLTGAFMVTVFALFAYSTDDRARLLIEQVLSSQQASAIQSAGQWRTYAYMNPAVSHVTVYDGAPLVDGDTITARIKRNKNDEPREFCTDSINNPDNEWCYVQYDRPYIYNHDSALARYRGVWYAMWNANDKKAITLPSPAAIEGVTGQVIVMATSTNFRSWSEPVEVFVDPEYTKNPVTRDADARQWQPGMIVVGRELWVFWTQNHGETSGTYLSKLKGHNAKWETERLDLPQIPRGYAFVSVNPIELRSGRIMLPVTPFTSPRSNAVIYTDDRGKTWNVSEYVEPPRNVELWEPVVVEDPKKDNTVYMYMRNRNEEDHGSDRMFLFSESTDGGRTWSDPEFMPLEVVSSRAHALTVGGRVMVVHNDFENGKAGRPGREQRDGRTTDVVSPDHKRFPDNDRVNLALFMSREGTPGTFLPGPGISGELRGVAYPQMEMLRDRLYVIHSLNGSRSIGGIIVDPVVPDSNKYLLYPRTSVVIDEKNDKLSTYSALVKNRNTRRVEQQASVSIETDQVNYKNNQALELQFSFDSRNRVLKGSDERMALLTIGGPDDYGVLEIGRPGYEEDIVFARGDDVTPITPYIPDEWQDVEVRLHADGVTFTIGGEEKTVGGAFDIQKLFFGYGYTQGKPYQEAEYNPDGYFLFRVNDVKSRTVVLK